MFGALRALPLDEPTALETAYVRAAVRFGAGQVLIERLERSIRARQSLEAEVEALGRIRSAASLPLLLDGIVRMVAVGWERQRPRLLRAALGLAAVRFLFQVLDAFLAFGSDQFLEIDVHRRAVVLAGFDSKRTAACGLHGEAHHRAAREGDAQGLGQAGPGRVGGADRALGGDAHADEPGERQRFAADRRVGRDRRVTTPVQAPGKSPLRREPRRGRRIVQRYDGRVACRIARRALDPDHTLAHGRYEDLGLERLADSRGEAESVEPGAGQEHGVERSVVQS